jgi:hypothetical protein
VLLELVSNYCLSKNLQKLRPGLRRNHAHIALDIPQMIGYAGLSDAGGSIGGVDDIARARLDLRALVRTINNIDSTAKTRTLTTEE